MSQQFFQAALRFGECGTQLDRPAQMIDGLLIMPRLRERVAEILMRFGKVGAMFDRAAKVIDGCGRPQSSGSAAKSPR